MQLVRVIQCYQLQLKPHKAGLTDRVIAKGIKTNIEAGMGVKATASDSLKGLALAAQLKGHGQIQKQPEKLQQTNVYINELKQMNDKDLANKVDALASSVKGLKDL